MPATERIKKKEKKKDRHRSKADVSIVNYSMDEFIQSQMEDLEKIGTSGALFEEVWQEY